VTDDQAIPDYDLDELVVITAPEQLRALADPLRTTLLELLLERAATVTEMAQAVDRPVRAIEERYYGRVARTLYIGVLNRPEDRLVAASINSLAQAVAESAAAHANDELRCTLVHARIPIEHVRAFWSQVQALARGFAQIPRGGDQVYGFVAGLYPTDAPTLPDAGHEVHA